MIKQGKYLGGIMGFFVCLFVSKGMLTEAFPPVACNGGCIFKVVSLLSHYLGSSGTNA